MLQIGVSVLVALGLGVWFGGLWRRAEDGAERVRVVDNLMIEVRPEYRYGRE